MRRPVPRLRHSICNDLFQGRSFADAAKAIRGAGYTGIEIAPFTLSDDPAALAPARRRELRAILESEGLEFAGFHWLLATPKGLHVSAPDRALRGASWDYLRRIIELCADLGPHGVLVFGSPKQRSTTGGLTPAEATRHLVEGFVEIAPYARERGTCVLLEALSPDQTDVVTTLDEAAAIVRQIDNPGLRTLFDTHNAVGEVEPHDVLLERHFDLIRHIHVNEADGRQPGSGKYDFRPVLDVLLRRGYSGWVSLEYFGASDDPAGVAAGSIKYLEKCVATPIPRG